MNIAALNALAEHGQHWGGPGGGGWGFPGLWFLLIIGGIITAIVLSRRSQKSEPRRDAEANLVSRFASGEITTEEYRARRAVLREKP